MPRPVALLDANVLYPARLRDLLVRLAVAGEYQARWTDRVLDECFQNLLADRPELPAEHLHRSRRLMNIAVPDALVTGYEQLIEALELPDHDDRHVLAAAMVADANYIVTANLSDFPADALPAGVIAVSPDAFVLMLIRADLDAVAAVIDEQAAALRSPAMTTGELLEGLEVVGLTMSVDAIRQAGS